MNSLLGIRVRKHRYAFQNQLDISLFSQLPDGKFSVATNIEYTIFDPNEGTHPNFNPLEMDVTQAQVLMDDLWNCGIRPTEGAGSAGAMAAQSKHLEDMRHLVFKTKP